jgi:hypothetical protein
MSPIYPEGGKITAKHPDLWVCRWVLGRLRRKLRLEFARHCDGDFLKGDILDDVPRDTGDEDADTACVFDGHVTDYYVRERSRRARHISRAKRATAAAQPQKDRRVRVIDLHPFDEDIVYVGTVDGEDLDGTEIGFDDMAVTDPNCGKVACGLGANLEGGAARRHGATLDGDVFARLAAGGLEADRVIAGLDGTAFDVHTLARIDVDPIVIGEAERADADVRDGHVRTLKDVHGPGAGVDQANSFNAQGGGAQA